MLDLTPESLIRTGILIAIFLLVAFPVHEFAHAATAYWLGDGTAKMFGRLTLNPVAHFDRFGGLMLVITAFVTPFLFGWAKPTPVNPANLRDRRNGEVLVAVAGPASNLLLALIGAFVFRILDAMDVAVPQMVGEVILSFVVFNVALMLFNLLPIPPLDGSAILFRFLDPQRAWQLRPVLAQYGFVILLVLIFFFSRPLSELIFGVTRVLVGR
jgi:Zn-dependent protease